MALRRFPCIFTRHTLAQKDSLFTVVRRVHQRYERRWESVRWCLTPSIIAGLGLGAGYVLLRSHRREADCQDSVQLCGDNQVKSNGILGDNLDKPDSLPFREAVRLSDELLRQVQIENSCPGLVVTVSVDGKQVMSRGYGLADVENDVPCKPSTVMRIASISKPMTMVAVARLWEQGKLDFDKSIKHYIPSWPDKTYKGKKVTITTRQLVSMTAGIRHYEKCQKNEVKTKDVDKTLKEKSKMEDEFDNSEYYIKNVYPSVTASLDIFKDDELCNLPGTEYLYSTYSFSVVSAVVEGASGGKKFTDIMKTIFYDLGLENTFLDENLPIIHNRARSYVLDKKSNRLINAPFVENSYKWAGGGFLSTTPDLCRFGNAMLYSFQWTKEHSAGAAPGYLQPDTMRMLWSPVIKRGRSNRHSFYGMGWGVVPPTDRSVEPGGCGERSYYVGHTGGAVGASSTLVILPRRDDDINRRHHSMSHRPPPRGVVVAIIVNMQNVSLNKTALSVAKLFDNVLCFNDEK